MKPTIAIAGLCVLFFVTDVKAHRLVGRLHPGAVCTEGSSWREECNWCYCQSGRIACTLTECLPGFRSDEPECVAGSAWRVDCNWCRCTATGVKACTEKACLLLHQGGTVPSLSKQVTAAQPVTTLESDLLTDDMECEPGSWFRLKCNTCACSREGKKLCTKRHCPPGTYRSDIGCVGEARFKDEDNCNWCSCSNDTVSCTLRACLTPDDYPAPTSDEQDW